MVIAAADTEVLNHPVTVVAAIVLTVIGAELFLVLPMIIGAAATDLGLNEQQVGIVGAAGMLGAAVSAALSVFWVRKVDWRRAATVAVGILVLGQIGCMLVDGFRLFAVLFATASLGGGATYSLVLTVLSDHHIPDRVFGYSITAQVAFQVVALLLLPTVAQYGGLDGVLGVLCAVAIAGLGVTRLLPRRGRAVAPSRIGAVMRQPAVILALLGCLMFFFNVGVFWTYIERMGNAEEFGGNRIGAVLAVGVAVGMLGSMSAAWLGERFGRLRALSLGAVGTVVAVAILGKGMAIWTFVIGVAIFNFVWNFSLTYQYAVVAAADASGRSVAVAPAFHALGASVGPAIAALFVSSQSFLAVQILCATGVMISLLLFALALCRPGSVTIAQ